MKALYKYPQAEYPYTKLEQESYNRSADEPEFELEDSGMFLCECLTLSIKPSCRSLLASLIARFKFYISKMIALQNL